MNVKTPNQMLDVFNDARQRTSLYETGFAGETTPRPQAALEMDLDFERLLDASARFLSQSVSDNVASNRVLHEQAAWYALPAAPTHTKESLALRRKAATLHVVDVESCDVHLRRDGVTGNE